MKRLRSGLVTVHRRHRIKIIVDQRYHDITAVRTLMLTISSSLPWMSASRSTDNEIRDPIRNAQIPEYTRRGHPIRQRVFHPTSNATVCTSRYGGTIRREDRSREGVLPENSLQSISWRSTLRPQLGRKYSMASQSTRTYLHD